MNALSKEGNLAQAHQVVLKTIKQQHPEWVDENGNCPHCDSYEYELATLMEHYAPESE